jgi:hypothetical protein
MARSAAGDGTTTIHGSAERPSTSFSLPGVQPPAVPTRLCYTLHRMEQRELEQLKAAIDGSLDLKLAGLRRDMNSSIDQKFAEQRKDIDASFEKHLASVHEEISDFREDADRRFGKLDDRLMAVESKLAGTDRRLDDELLRRNDLETRVRSVVPNLPPKPQLI